VAGLLAAQQRRRTAFATRFRREQPHDAFHDETLSAY
jgi:hypothetical protein